MHDINGKPLHPGDRVRTKAGDEFHIHGYTTQDHTGAKHVAFAGEVELVSKHPANEHKPDLGGGSIVWGNGPKPAEDDGTGPK